MISQFQLDFVTKSLAMRRFQAQADPLRFRLDRQGRVKRLEVFGTSFIRRDSSYFENFQELKTNAWRFLFPKTYHLEREAGVYRAINEQDDQIFVFFEEGKNEFRWHRLFPDEFFEKQGGAYQQQIGNIRWEQQSFIGSKSQLMLLRTRGKAKNISILLYTKVGKLSQLASRDLYGILSSLSIAE